MEKAFYLNDDNTIRDWQTGDILNNYEGLCLAVGIWFHTWIENGERHWQSLFESQSQALLAEAIKEQPC